MNNLNEINKLNNSNQSIEEYIEEQMQEFNDKDLTI